MCLLSDRNKPKPANTSCPLCTFLRCMDKKSRLGMRFREQTLVQSFENYWPTCRCFFKQWMCLLLAYMHAGWEGKQARGLWLLGDSH